MGYSTILDIIGSAVIGGMLLLLLMRMNASSSENLFKNSGELNTQRNLVTLAQLIEYDFRRMGYCSNIQDPNTRQGINIIVLADTSRIDFYADIADASGKDVPTGDGVADLVSYRLGAASESEVLNTPNPNDRVLYKSINGVVKTTHNCGITKFRLHYFNAVGDTLTATPLTAPTGILSMQIDLVVEEVFSYDNKYTKDRSSYWRQIRIQSKNLSK